MPLFEYRCPSCGAADERLVRAPAPDAVSCASCGAQARRLVPLLAPSGQECGPAAGST